MKKRINPTVEKIKRREIGLYTYFSIYSKLSPLCMLLLLFGGAADLAARGQSDGPHRDAYRERGIIKAEYFADFDGASIDDFYDFLATNPVPTSEEYIESMQINDERLRTHAVKISGYYIPASSGGRFPTRYFGLSSSGHSSVRVSESGEPELAVEMLRLESPTNPLEFSMGESVRMQTGIYFYIEAVMIPGLGNPHFAVWDAAKGRSSPISIEIIDSANLAVGDYPISDVNVVQTTQHSAIVGMKINYLLDEAADIIIGWQTGSSGMTTVDSWINSLTISGIETVGYYEFEITGLDPQTTYYFRPFLDVGPYNYLPSSSQKFQTLAEQNNGFEWVWFDDSFAVGTTADLHNMKWVYGKETSEIFSGILAMAADHNKTATLRLSNVEAPVYVDSQDWVSIFVHLKDGSGMSWSFISDDNSTAVAYWGDETPNSSADTNYYMGDMPAKNEWVRLFVPVSELGFSEQNIVSTILTVSQSSDDRGSRATAYFDRLSVITTVNVTPQVGVDIGDGVSTPITSLEVPAVEDTSLEIPAVEDTYVSEFNPNKNYGDIEWMNVRYSDESNLFKADAYIKFDLSNVSFSSYSTAELKLHIKPTATPRYANIIYFGEDSWDEDTLTYNNVPKARPTFLMLGEQWTGVVSTVTLSIPYSYIEDRDFLTIKIELTDKTFQWQNGFYTKLTIFSSETSKPPVLIFSNPDNSSDPEVPDPTTTDIVDVTVPDSFDLMNADEIVTTSIDCEQDLMVTSAYSSLFPHTDGIHILTKNGPGAPSATTGPKDTYEDAGIYSILKFNIDDLDSSNGVYRATVNLIPADYDSQDDISDTTLSLVNLPEAAAELLRLQQWFSFGEHTNPANSSELVSSINTQEFLNDITLIPTISDQNQFYFSAQTALVSFDITEAVKEAVENDRTEIMLCLYDRFGSTVKFHSMRSPSVSKRPYLSVTYGKTAEAITKDAGGRTLANIVTDVPVPSGYEEFGWFDGMTAVDAQGNFTYTLPVHTPAGMNGMSPSVALSYNSGRNVEGVLGRGWSLDYGQAKIERRKLNLVDDGEISLDKYDETKLGFSLNGMPLRKVELGNQHYFVTDNDIHARITRWDTTGRTNIYNDYHDRLAALNGSPGKNNHWVIHHKSGLKQTFRHRVRGQAEATNDERAEAWLLSEEEDRYGNKIVYTYDAATSLITSIQYAYVDNNTANLSVVFTYTSKNRKAEDNRVVYRDGERYTPDSRELSKIEVKSGTDFYRTYTVRYQSEEPANIKLVERIGIYDGEFSAATGGQNPDNMLDEHVFEYHTSVDVAEGFGGNGGYEIPLPVFGCEFQTDDDELEDTVEWVDVGVRWFDINEDGLLDLIQGLHLEWDAPYILNPRTESTIKSYINTGAGFEESNIELPVTLIGNIRKGDAGKLNSIQATVRAELIDINGDGRLDLMDKDGKVYINRGYASLTADNRQLWVLDENYQIPDVNEHWWKHLWQDARNPVAGRSHLFRDFNGDGLVDIYVTYSEGGVFHNENERSIVKLYYNNGSGWGDADFNVTVEKPSNRSLGAKEVHYVNNSSLTGTQHFIPGHVHSPSANASHPNGVLVDVNGDGLIDYVHDISDIGTEDSFYTDFETGSVMTIKGDSDANLFNGVVFINNGEGFERWLDDNGDPITIPQKLISYEYTFTLGSFAGKSAYVPHMLARFSDLNNDGLADIIYADEDDSSGKGVYLNTGKGWEPTKNTQFTGIQSHCSSDKNWDLGAKYIDLNGDGFLDFIKNFKAYKSSTQIASTNTQYMLNNGAGFNPLVTSTGENDSSFLYPTGPLAVDRSVRFIRKVVAIYDEFSETMTVGMLMGPFDPVANALALLNAERIANVFYSTMAGLYALDTVADVYNGMHFPEIGTGNGFIDINGDGILDAISAMGELKLTSERVVSQNVSLNRRSSTYLKMKEAKNNLNSTTVNYDPLTAKGVLISKQEPVAGDSSEQVLTNPLPLGVVKSLIIDSGGHNHEVKYFYGDFAIQPRKGYAFGEMWEVDETFRSVGLSGYNVATNSRPLFGVLNQSSTYRFEMNRHRFDRNNDDDIARLINGSSTADKDGLIHSLVQVFSYSSYYSYSGEDFNANDEYIFTGPNIGTDRRPYEPYFLLMTLGRAVEYDLSSGNQVSMTATGQGTPTRFGSPMASSSNLSQYAIEADLTDGSVTSATSALPSNALNNVQTGSSYVYSHHISEEDWIVDRLDSITFENKIGNFPGAKTKSVVTAMNYDNTKKWQLQSIETGNENDSDTEIKVTAFTYHSFGSVNETSHYDKNDSDKKRTTTVTYSAANDALKNRAVTSVGDGLNTITYSDHDTFSLLPETIVDGNGLSTTLTHDMYDRVKKTVHPDGQQRVMMVKKAANDTYAYSVETHSSGPHYRFTEFDNLGRALKTYAPGPDWDGNLASKDTWLQVIHEYRPDGLLESSSVPLAFNMSQVQAKPGEIGLRYHYDQFGRIKQVLDRGHVNVYYTYGFDTKGQKVTVKDAIHDRTIIRNLGAQGKITTGPYEGKVFDFTKTTGYGHTSVIRTDADPVDSKIDVDTTILTEYDLFGRRIRLSDPSFGVQTYAYNAFDELETVTKNANTPDVTVINYRRDEHGRVTEIVYTGKRQQQIDEDGNVQTDSENGFDQPMRIERYVYDNLPAGETTKTGEVTNFKGYLYQKSLWTAPASAARNSTTGKYANEVRHFAETTFPDSYGRTVRTRTYILDDTESPAVSYNFESSQTYDNLSRVSNKVYPQLDDGDGVVPTDGYDVTNHYSPAGQLEAIYGEKNTKLLWSALKVDLDGFLRVEQLGDNIIVSQEPDTRRRLVKTSAVLADGTGENDLMKAVYSYYDDSTMQDRTFALFEDDRVLTHEHFEYDLLKQLKRVTHSYILEDIDSFVEGETVPTRKRELNYVYDRHSRMLTKDRIGNDLEVETLHFGYPNIDNRNQDSWKFPGE